MPYPNLIIAGPPKTGTTSIFDWLRKHPDVGTSTTKEPHYFYLLGDSETEYKEFDEDDFEVYKRLFSSENKKIICEASTRYFFSHSAIHGLKKFMPETRILVIHRNPAERLFSEYRFHRYKTKRFKGDFADFLGYENGAFNSERIQEGNFAHYLSYWYKAFSENQLLLMEFDDLKASPNEFRQRLFQELGLKNIENSSVAAKNETQDLRSRWLHQQLQKLSSFLPTRIKDSLSPFYFKLGSRPIPQPTNEELDLLTKLNGHFEESENRFYDVYADQMIRIKN